MPEVLGLPLCDCLEQVRFGAAMQLCGRLHRLLELAPILSQSRYSGRTFYRIPTGGSGRAGLVPQPGERIGSEAEETSPAKVLLRGCKGLSSPIRSGSAAPTRGR